MKNFASSHKFILDDGGYNKLDSRTFIVNGGTFYFYFTDMQILFELPMSFQVIIQQIH